MPHFLGRRSPAPLHPSRSCFPFPGLSGFALEALHHVRLALPLRKTPALNIMLRYQKVCLLVDFRSRTWAFFPGGVSSRPGRWLEVIFLALTTFTVIPEERKDCIKTIFPYSSRSFPYGLSPSPAPSHGPCLTRHVWSALVSSCYHWSPQGTNSSVGQRCTVLH